MKTIITVVICVFLLVVACSKSNNDAVTPPANCSTTITYAANVSPLIQSFCATNSGCHGSGSFNGPGELLTYQQVFSARSSIRSAVSSGRMPLNTTLSSEQKSTITCWVDNGAINN
ncbi:MAG TPA: hypothetical protein VF476_01430 [Chitinophagaceae bacterium]